MLLLFLYQLILIITLGGGRHLMDKIECRHFNALKQTWSVNAICSTFVLY